jgi:hypothetical protein
MAKNADTRAAGPGAAADALERETGADDTPPARSAQALPPRELHDPIAADKLVLFEVAPVHRLVGTWQGPGRISELSRRPRP